MRRPPRFSGKSLIQVLVSIFRIAFLLLAINMIIWVLLTIVCLATNTQIPLTFYHVMFSLASDGILQLPDNLPSSSFQMPVATAWVYATGLSKGFIIAYNILQLLSVSAILLSLRLTIKILETAETGAFFAAENAIRLRGIALSGVAILFFYRLASLLSASYLKDKVEVPGLIFTNFYTFSFVDFLYLINFLFILVVAEAFRVGTLVKAEHDLTI